MDEQTVNENNMGDSQFTTDGGKEEMYLYSLRHLAVEKAEAKMSPLTGLYVTSAFFYMSNEMIRDNPDCVFGMIVMDILQFKAVNEFCGRETGDRLLIYIAEILRKIQKERPLTRVGHLRADNFVLCTAYMQKEELAELAAQIRDAIGEFPMAYHVHPSFGICAMKDSKPNASFMKDCATVALNTIKGKFFADYAFFDDEMRKQMLHERQVESDIVQAMKEGQLVPFIQPKVDMKSGRIVGGEALVRWINKEHKIIPPGQFIPVLEKNGFIISVDKSIWEQVFRFLKERKDKGLNLVPISVNVSRLHIYDDTMCATLEDLRDRYEIDPSLIWLELTESAFLEDVSGIYEKMMRLQELGFHISMDDFGTGYSSLFMLKDQPVDEVKMDREFILGLENARSRVILEHVSSMLRSLHDKIVVEGVETEEQRQILLENGLNDAQGFLFYKPMPLSEFADLLDAQE